MALPPLYKFLDVTGAKLTLRNRNFKFAKPSDFNDTEDLTIQSIFPEETEVALRKISDNFTDIILQHLDDPPTCDNPTDRGRLRLLQSLYKANPAAADIVKREIAKGAGEEYIDVEAMRARSAAFIEDINAHMQDFRVLCVTTLIDSERMWNNYAEGHKGIALRIEPNVAKDSKFQLFRPVIYRAVRPPFFDDTLEFVAGSLFGDQQARRMAAMNKIITAKTNEWAHEREYRMAIPILPGEAPWNTLAFHPEEITELYLGRNMNGEVMTEIIAIALKINPEISIFIAEGGDNGKVQFARIQMALG